MNDRWHELHCEAHAGHALLTEALGINGGVLLAVRQFKAEFDSSHGRWIFNRNELLHETLLFLPKALLQEGYPYGKPPRIDMP